MLYHRLLIFAKGIGIHWTALILTSKTAFIYDSFARDPKTILPRPRQPLKKIIKFSYEARAKVYVCYLWS